ncbi:MAG: hypothetical protein U0264_14040 [Candidatus Kapaibacterium sp.]
MFIELTIAALDGRRECPPSHDDEAARLPHCARLLVVTKISAKASAAQAGGISELAQQHNNQINTGTYAV